MNRHIRYTSSFFSQSTKRERMLRDIKTYMEIFESEPSRKKVPLKELLEQVIRGLLSRGGYGKPTIEMDIPDEAAYILADPGDMRSFLNS